MYNIVKLSSESQSFLSQIVSSGRSRTAVAAIALARMLASSFTMPSAPVEDIEQEYRMNAAIRTMKVVSIINEMAPVDTDLVTSLARAFYSYRYANAHPTCHVFSFREGQYLQDFFEVSRHFSPEILKVIECEGADLAFYANGFRAMISDIESKDEAVAFAQQAALNAG